MGWLPAGMAGCGSSPPPGWIVAVVVYAGYLGVAVRRRAGRAVAPARPARRHHRGRGHPLVASRSGACPLASLAISQAAGPLAPVVRVGGGAAAHVADRRRSAWRCRPSSERAVAAGAVAGLGRRARCRARRRHAGAHAVTTSADAPHHVRPGRRPAGHARHRHRPRGRVPAPPRRHAAIAAGPGRPRGVARERRSTSRVLDQRRAQAEVAAEAARLGVPLARRHHRGRRPRALPQRPGRRAARRLARRPLRQGAPRALRRVPAAAVAASSSCPGQPTDLVPPRRRRRRRARPCSTRRRRHGSAWSSRGRCSSAGGRATASKHGGQVLLNPTNGSSYTGHRSCRPSRSPRRGCGPSRRGAGSCRSRRPGSAPSSRPTARCSTAPASASRPCAPAPSQLRDGRDLVRPHRRQAGRGLAAGLVLAVAHAAGLARRRTPARPSELEQDRDRARR